MRHGFSLVELSIVLVILGLLTGGILAGQSLIRASQLRAVSTEYSRYLTAAQTFRDKYFSIPGDFASATKFWTANASCPGDHTTGSTTATCNGYGDGTVNNSTNEMYRFWQHMALAGLIEGSYTGVYAVAATPLSLTSANAPVSKLSSSLWGARTFITFSDANWFLKDYRNIFQLGLVTPFGFPETPNLKPEELWNIDTKMDDGRPAYGKIIALYWDSCTDAANNTALTANYDLSNSAVACAVIVADAF